MFTYALSGLSTACNASGSDCGNSCGGVNTLRGCGASQRVRLHTCLFTLSTHTFTTHRKMTGSCDNVKENVIHGKPI